LRGRVGVGVLPQNALVEGIGFLPPAAMAARYSAASDMTDAGMRLSQPSRNRFSHARSATS
jgi:hypothetical protein